MARPLRIEVADGIYHVVARGNDRQRIFLDDADRHNFLRTLRQALARFRWCCLTYCLMGNHYHLVVRITAPNLSRGMRHLNGVYAQRFHRRHDTCGHLFQGRFSSRLVVVDAHLVEVVRYVALNPVRAGYCANPEEWRWSAHPALIGVASSRLIQSQELLARFSADPAEARRRYAAFVREALDHSSPSEDELTGEASEHVPSDPPSPEISRRPWRVGRPSLDELLDDNDEGAAIATAYRDHGYLLREIADALGYHYSTVSRRLRAFEGNDPGPQDA